MRLYASLMFYPILKFYEIFQNPRENGEAPAAITTNHADERYTTYTVCFSFLVRCMQKSECPTLTPPSVVKIHAK